MMPKPGLGIFPNPGQIIDGLVVHPGQTEAKAGLIATDREYLRSVGQDDGGSSHYAFRTLFLARGDTRSTQGRDPAHYPDELM